MFQIGGSILNDEESEEGELLLDLEGEAGTELPMIWGKLTLLSLFFKTFFSYLTLSLSLSIEIEPSRNVFFFKLSVISSSRPFWLSFSAFLFLSAS